MVRWLRKFGFSLTVSIVTACGFSGSALALSSSGASQVPDATQLIWCGLWSGADFTLSNPAGCTFTSGSEAPGGAGAATAPGSTTNGLDYTNNYIALGDSVAAGAGLAPTPNGNTLDVECSRSSQAYPNQVAIALNMPLGHVACSGATAGDLVTEQDDLNGPNAPAQLDNAFQNGVPRLMTITAGANDAHWADFIRACYVTTCNTQAYTVAANSLITLMQAKLSYGLSSIQARSGGRPPQVILTGYYDPLSSNCASLQQNITPSEISWLDRETNNINNALQSMAAQYGSFVHYTALNFSGHDICSSDPWVQGLNDPAPFHPTAEGQAQIADTILPVAENALRQ